MIAGGEAVGLDTAQATTLARQTVFGAAKLMIESGEEATALRTKVTSPGGTTAAGLTALDAAGFTDAVEACISAATARGQELGEEARRKLDES